MAHIIELLLLFVMTYFSLWLVGFALCFLVESDLDLSTRVGAFCLSVIVRKRTVSGLDLRR